MLLWLHKRISLLQEACGSTRGEVSSLQFTFKYIHMCTTICHLYTVQTAIHCTLLTSLYFETFHNKKLGGGKVYIQHIYSYLPNHAVFLLFVNFCLWLVRNLRNYDKGKLRHHGLKTTCLLTWYWGSEWNLTLPFESCWIKCYMADGST